MKHIISVLVENRVGVLSHVAGMFSSRGYNIASVAVAETQDPTMSRMTIVVDADERILEQIMKQLRKIIDVIKVQDFTGEDFIDRELVLVKVDAKPTNRSEIMQVADAFHAHVVDVNPRNLTIEITGNQPKIDAMLELLREFGIKEIVRTGRIAVSRGGKNQ